MWNSKRKATVYLSLNLSRSRSSLMSLQMGRRHKEMVFVTTFGISVYRINWHPHHIYLSISLSAYTPPHKHLPCLRPWYIITTNKFSALILLLLLVLLLSPFVAALQSLVDWIYNIFFIFELWLNYRELYAYKCLCVCAVWLSLLYYLHLFPYRFIYTHLHI